MDYTIKGIVVEKETNTPIDGLRIEAWDKDFGTDDYLGYAVSGSGGNFTITFNESMFREWFFDRYPDIYFKIYKCGDLVKNTQDSVIWNVNESNTSVKIEVPITQMTTGWIERNIYLKIERIENYSTVRPQEKMPPPIQYGRDCMRNEGHEDGSIPEAEIQARSLTAVVYREYLDSAYLIPKTNKLVLADINEPVYTHRVPGTVIYARPNQRLRIHVWNCDNVPHSLHVHGLRYGIDSDGAWPFGTEAANFAGRSDAICPGDTWTYTFEVLENMVGAWPFHDHTHQNHMKIEQGLFGGIVVLPCQERPPRPLPFPGDFVSNAYKRIAENEKLKINIDNIFRKNKTGKENDFEESINLPSLFHIKRLKKSSLQILKAQVDYLEEFTMRELFKIKRRISTDHVPIFFHRMSSRESKPTFDSGDIEELNGSFEFVFASPGEHEYFCQHHPIMTGIVKVVPGGPAQVTAHMIDGPPMAFSPSEVEVGVGGTVRWENHSIHHHTVTSKQGAALPTHCLNGRGFVGNSPTIVVPTGQRIKWYIFNLDTSTTWHNFHPHSMRWNFAGENIDVRSMGPAESFIAETQAPPVILLDESMAEIQDPEKRPNDAKLYRLKGDFIFHCHVHHHMMNGMIGLVRSKQNIWLTDAMVQTIQNEIGLSLDDGTNSCPQVESVPCGAKLGWWEEIEGQPEVTFMHAALLPQTKKVLYWGYTDSEELGGQTRLWDYSTPTGSYSFPANQPASLPGQNENSSDLWSAEHAFLDDQNGTLLAHGGLTMGSRHSFLFDPSTETWSQTDDTTDSRFYSTTITNSDGKIITLFGSASKTIEIYDPLTGSWSTPINLPAAPESMWHHQYYPWTYLLPDGKLFIAGPHDPTQLFNWSGPIVVESFNTNRGDRSSGGEKGSSVLLILRPPEYKPIVNIMGGDLPGTSETAEEIDLSSPTPSWNLLPNLNFPRSYQFTSTLLPDGRVFIAGGISGAANGGPCEIFDPYNPNEGWQLGPTMKYTRGYHSAFILLSDGSILAGGDPKVNGQPTPHERFYPDYFNKPRPIITNITSTTIHFGESFSISTPNASDITEIVLLRPGAVTHGFNMSQRGLELAINSIDANDVEVSVPSNPNLVPPGWYLLFILNSNRIPSEGEWIRITH